MKNRKNIFFFTHVNQFVICNRSLIILSSHTGNKWPRVKKVIYFVMQDARERSVVIQCGCSEEQGTLDERAKNVGLITPNSIISPRREGMTSESIREADLGSQPSDRREFGLIV